MKIETGYMIGGRTPISTMWNEDTLTKECVVDLINEYKHDLTINSIENAISCVLDDVATLRDKFLEGEESTEGGGYAIKEYIEREVGYSIEMTAAIQEIIEVLQDLSNKIEDPNFADPTYDRESLFDYVMYAHHKIDDHTRNEKYGEYYK